MKKIFIDKNINWYDENISIEKLKEVNDSCFLKNLDDGIIDVNVDRWKIAQQYEKKIWSNYIGDDDRNFEHMSCFDDYNILKNINFDNLSIIELGCGPFTNLRLILSKLNNNIGKVDLLDPMINFYTELENCHYKNKKLNNIDVNLINDTIENFYTNEKYDIVVMINVLEHTYNIKKIFENIYYILKNGGIFIFSDCCINNNSISELVLSIYDAGHPIRITESKMDDFLKKYSVLYQNILYQRYNQPWRIDKYLILKKI